MGASQSTGKQNIDESSCVKGNCYVENLLKVQHKNFLESNSMESKEVLLTRKERILSVLKERKSVKPYALQLLEVRASAIKRLSPYPDAIVTQKDPFTEESQPQVPEKQTKPKKVMVRFSSRPKNAKKVQFSVASTPPPATNKSTPILNRPQQQNASTQYAMSLWSVSSESEASIKQSNIDQPEAQVKCKAEVSSEETITTNVPSTLAQIESTPTSNNRPSTPPQRQQTPKSSKPNQSSTSFVRQTIPKSSKSNQSPTSSVTQTIPKSSKPNQSPTSTVRQTIPKSSKSNQSPTSSVTLTTPKSSKSNQSPKSSVGQTTPKSSKPNQSPTSSVTQTTPKSSKPDQSPTSSVTQTTPKSSKPDQSPTSSVTQTTPKSSKPDQSPTSSVTQTTPKSSKPDQSLTSSVTQTTPKSSKPDQSLTSSVTQTTPKSSKPDQSLTSSVTQTTPKSSKPDQSLTSSVTQTTPKSSKPDQSLTSSVTQTTPKSSKPNQSPTSSVTQTTPKSSKPDQSPTSSVTQTTPKSSKPDQSLTSSVTQTTPKSSKPNQSPMTSVRQTTPMFSLNRTSTQPTLANRIPFGTIYSKSDRQFNSKVLPILPSSEELMETNNKQENRKEAHSEWKSHSSEEEIYYVFRDPVTRAYPIKNYRLLERGGFSTWRDREKKKPIVNCDSDDSYGRRRTAEVDRLTDSLIANWSSPKNSAELLGIDEKDLSLMSYRGHEMLRTVPHQPISRKTVCQQRCHHHGTVEPTERYTLLSWDNFETSDLSRDSSSNSRCRRHQPK